MRTQVTEQRDVTWMSELDPALISREAVSKHEISAGFNSTKQLMFAHDVHSISCGLIKGGR